MTGLGSLTAAMYGMRYPGMITARHWRWSAVFMCQASRLSNSCLMNYAFMSLYSRTTSSKVVFETHWKRCTKLNDPYEYKDKFKYITWLLSLYRPYSMSWKWLPYWCWKVSVRILNQCGVSRKGSLENLPLVVSMRRCRWPWYWGSPNQEDDSRQLQ